MEFSAAVDPAIASDNCIEAPQSCRELPRPCCSSRAIGPNLTCVERCNWSKCVSHASCGGLRTDEARHFQLRQSSMSRGELLNRYSSQPSNLVASQLVGTLCCVQLAAYGLRTITDAPDYHVSTSIDGGPGDGGAFRGLIVQRPSASSTGPPESARV
jgi:hypothetical protein